MMFQNDNHKQNYSDSIQQKQRKTNWLPWTLVGIMGILLVSQYFGNSGTAATTAPLSEFNWFSLLAGLICPLMMLFMMSGHSHGHNHFSESDQESDNGKAGHGGCCSGHQANK